jgi:hypothetical protein
MLLPWLPPPAAWTERASLFVPPPCDLIGQAPELLIDRFVLVGEGESWNLIDGAAAVLRQGGREEGAVDAGGGRQAAGLHLHPWHRQLGHRSAEGRSWRLHVHICTVIRRYF